MDDAELKLKAKQGRDGKQNLVARF